MKTKGTETVHLNVNLTKAQKASMTNVGLTVTVIVTAYNVEATITSTLLSLAEQTYPNIEIIVVDDASTDNTPAILATFAEKHSCVRILRNKRNLGAAMSKQRGIREVNSDYFILCDGDDCIEPNAISECIKTIDLTSADTVIFGFDHQDSNTGKYFATTLPVDVTKLPYLMCRDDGFNVERLSRLSHISPVCLLKTEIHQNSFADALLPIPYWEDVPTFIAMLAHAKIIALINEPFYHYRVGHQGQSVNNWTRVRRGLKAVCLDRAVQYLSKADWASNPRMRKLQAYKLGRIAINECTVMRGAGNDHEYALTIMQFRSAIKGFTAVEIFSLRGLKFKIFMIALRWAPIEIIRRVIGKGKR